MGGMSKEKIMANKREIELIINKDGTVEVEQLGWKGKDCENSIDDLLNAIGKPLSKKRTKEWYKQQKTQIHQHRTD